jgi:hypothetical protein
MAMGCLARWRAASEKVGLEDGSQEGLRRLRIEASSQDVGFLPQSLLLFHDKRCQNAPWRACWRSLDELL